MLAELTRLPRHQHAVLEDLAMVAREGRALPDGKSKSAQCSIQGRMVCSSCTLTTQKPSSGSRFTSYRLPCWQYHRVGSTRRAEACSACRQPSLLLPSVCVCVRVCVTCMQVHSAVFLALTSVVSVLDKGAQGVKRVFSWLFRKRSRASDNTGTWAPRQDVNNIANVKDVPVAE